MQKSHILCRDLKRYKSLIILSSQAFIYTGVFVERTPMARSKLLSTPLIRVLYQTLLAVIEALGALFIRLQGILRVERHN